MFKLIGKEIFTILRWYFLFILTYMFLGTRWKQGQWTKDEVDLLQINISDYCKVRAEYPRL